MIDLIQSGVSIALVRWWRHPVIVAQLSRLDPLVIRAPGCCLPPIPPMYMFAVYLNDGFAVEVYEVGYPSACEAQTCIALEFRPAQHYPQSEN